jgi:hypothetical protein
LRHSRHGGFSILIFRWSPWGNAARRAGDRAGRSEVSGLESRALRSVFGPRVETFAFTGCSSASRHNRSRCHPRYRQYRERQAFQHRPSHPAHPVRTRRLIVRKEVRRTISERRFSIRWRRERSPSKRQTFYWRTSMRAGSKARQSVKNGFDVHRPERQLQ